MTAYLNVLNISVMSTDREIFLNIIKSNRNKIVYAIFRLILNQKVVHLVPNISKNAKYNLISV